jgi:hypothetical protein
VNLSKCMSNIYFCVMFFAVMFLETQQEAGETSFYENVKKTWPLLEGHQFSLK